MITRRLGGGRRPRPLRPVRVSVPEFGGLEVLASAPGWVGPTLQEIATDARRFGWAAAILEVEWRLHQTKLAPRSPKALNRAIAPATPGDVPHRNGTTANAGRSPHVSTPPAEPTTSTTAAGSSTPNSGARRPHPGYSRPCPAPTGQNPTHASSCSGG